METIHTDILVLGAGPGGYTAAFHARDKGKKVVLVEQNDRLGGVCLNQGCIPSKALLHAAKVITQARESTARGISFADPVVDLEKLRAWKQSVVEKLNQGLRGLAQKRNVEVLRGKGCLENSQALRVEGADGKKIVHYEKAVIATGSKPVMPRSFDLKDKRVMSSTEALLLEDVPSDLLVVGGGYIGMELGSLYAALGSKVVVVEMLNSILGGADADLVRPVMRGAQKVFRDVRLNTKVEEMALKDKKIKVAFDQDGQRKEEEYEKVLVSVGRIPNSADLGLENTKVTRDEKGFIKVNARLQTEDPAIYAIGDVVGGLMLAHKASREAKAAVEIIVGGSGGMEKTVVPAVVFTDPEVAWCGLTEEQAKQKGISVEVARFPWSASGRAVSMDRPDGMTKLVVEPKTGRILGVGIAGTGADELISEGVLAVEMGATAKDLAQCVHPHPTLSETLMECAEMFYGASTHAITRKKS